MDLNCVCLLYPGKTFHYLKKENIDVVDLFQHFSKKRKYGDENIFCKYCNTYQNKVFKTNILFTSPPNLILQLDYKNNDFNLNIDETIDIKNFVKRKDISKTKYELRGAIFYEYKVNGEKIYTSISKDMNNQWIYFNGTKILSSNFNEILNHKNIQFLFYSISEEN